MGALTFDQLQAAIAKHITKDTTAGDTLALSDQDALNDLLSSDIQDVFNKSLGDKTLVINKSQSSPSAEKQTVTVTGQGSKAPFVGLQVTAIFGLDSSGAATASVTATKPSSDQTQWTFVQSFPSLDGTIYNNLQIADPQFTLDSTGPQKGLFFTGTLPVKGPLEILTELLSGKSVFPLSGPVTLTEDVPNMRLTAPLTDRNTSIGYFNIPINFGLVSTAVENIAPLAEPHYWAKAFAELSSNIQYDRKQAQGGNGPGTVSVPVSARFDTQTCVLAFEADLSSLSEDALKVGLSDFDSFMKKENIGRLIPKEFPLDPVLTLSRLTITVGVAPPSLQLLSVTLGVSQVSPWRVVGDTVRIENIYIEFGLTNPLAANKQLFCVMSGDLALDYTPPPSNAPDFVPPLIHFSMGYPGGGSDFYITGELEGTIDLSSAVAHFIPEAKKIQSDLMLDELKLYADPGGSSYLASVGIKSDWSLNIGIATLSLLSAGAEIVYSKNATPQTQCEIRATVEIDDAEFEIDWDVQQVFHFEGTIPRIALKSLATKLCGSFMRLPDGFPDITFNNAHVAISISSDTSNNSPGVTMYDLSLATDITVPNIGDLGIALFELRKGASDFGFVVGFVSPADWSPASIWSGLKDIFGLISFKGSALIISSLPQPTTPPTNITVQALPKTIQQGVTFCTTVELSSSLGLLAKLFDGLGGLTLVAVFDPNDATKTKFTASMGEAGAGKGVVSYDGLSLTFAAGQDSLSVTAALSATITIGGKQRQPADTLLVSGGAAMMLSPASSSATLKLLMTGAKKEGESGPGTSGWNNPFGINPKLTVVGVGIEVSISEDGFKFAVGGSIKFTDPSISDDPNQDDVVLTVIMEIIDGEDPGGFSASLTSDAPKGVSLARLVYEFTDFDLNWVPLLNELRLKTLDFYLVDDPTGFPDPLDPTKLLKPGFSVNTDLILYGVEAKMDIEVHPDRGIKASGNLSKIIQLADVLTISDAEGIAGAFAIIDTTTMTGSDPNGTYLKVSGKVSLFNLAEATLLAYVKKGAFNFLLHYNVAGIEEFDMDCSINGLKSFSADATISFGIKNRSFDLHIDGSDLGRITLDIDVTAGFDLQLSPQVFHLCINASFDFEDVPLDWSFTITESFSDLAQLVEKTFEQIAAAGWPLFEKALGDSKTLFKAIGKELTAYGNDFGKLLRQYYNLSLDDAIKLFKGVDSELADFVSQLKQGFSDLYSDINKTIANSMQEAGYEMNQIADALSKGLQVAAEDAAGIFYDLGYAADDIESALTGYFGKSADQAKQIVDDIFNDADKFCAAQTFAREIGASDGDLSALRQLRADLEKMPAGSKGRWYLDLYNQYSARVHQLIAKPGPVKNHITADKGQEIWNDIVEAVVSSQSGKPTSMPGREDQGNALDILSTIMQVDGTLASVIRQVTPDIESYTGLTYTEFLEAAKAPHTNGK